MSSFFFFNETATTESYSLSLHDALRIFKGIPQVYKHPKCGVATKMPEEIIRHRSEEHTSELQLHSDLVCRLLLEKKKKCLQKSDIIIKRPCRRSASICSKNFT